MSSSEETRMMTGKSGPTFARTARSNSTAKRARFSSEPPFSSVRLFENGERNWQTR